MGTAKGVWEDRWSFLNTGNQWKVRYLCTATGCLGRPMFFLFIRVAIDGDYGTLSICLSVFEGLQ